MLERRENGSKKEEKESSLGRKDGGRREEGWRKEGARREQGGSKEMRLKRGEGGGSKKI